MLVTVLFPFIPLIAAFPLFMMIVELRGHRPQSKLQALLLAFSFLFFAWHGFIARFLSAADFGGPFIRIIDMLLMLLLRSHIRLYKHFFLLFLAFRIVRF